MAATSDRGIDGTAAAQHASGATIRLCSTAIDADEANNVAHAILGQLAAKGDSFTGASATTLAKTSVGANGSAKVADSTQAGGINWAAPAGDLTGSYLTGPTIATGAVTDVKTAAANKDGVAGTASMRTLGTGAQQAFPGAGRIDQLAAPTAAVAWNAQKITGLANGSGAQDAAAFGQIPTLGTGAAQALAGNTTLAGDVTGPPSATVIAPGSVDAGDFAAGVLPMLLPFTRPGTLATGTGTIRFRVPVAMTIQHTRLAVGTAPTGTSGTPIAGQALVVNVVKNGTTIYTTQANRPTIADGANAETAITAPDVTALAAGDYLTVNVDYVGSTAAGADLSVIIYCLV